MTHVDESGLQESAGRFTPAALHLVFDLGLRVWTELGLVELCVRFSLLAAGPLFVPWFSSV
jgi:hypothetical protein